MTEFKNIHSHLAFLKKHLVQIFDSMENKKGYSKWTYNMFESYLKRYSNEIDGKNKSYVYDANDSRFHKINENSEVEKDENGNPVFDEELFIKTCQKKFLGDAFELFVAMALTFDEHAQNYGIIENTYWFSDDDEDLGTDAKGTLGSGNNSPAFIQCKFRQLPQPNPRPLSIDVYYKLFGNASRHHGFDASNKSHKLIFATNTSWKFAMTVPFKKEIGFVENHGIITTTDGILMDLEQWQRITDKQSAFWERFHKYVK